MPKKKETGSKWSNRWRSWSKPKKGIVLTGGVFLLWFLFCLPRPLFEAPTSTIVYSADNKLIGAKIATDGQWRFPYEKEVPERFAQAILLQEDEYFYYHPGFNPVSIYNALLQNIAAKKVVRGGSTITQQTIRLARRNPQRSYLEKLRELFMAMRLEMGTSKDRVLSYYCSYSPFGGNVVGLRAAAWRYFKSNPSDLSWAEVATLAVLPNAPGLIHPGRRREDLRVRRDALLHKLYLRDKIDLLTYEAAVIEPLPDRPYAMPQVAPHFTEYAHKDYHGKTVKSTINYKWQNATNRIIDRYYKVLRQNQIHNIAALIVDTRTNQIVAYTGNTDCGASHEEAVDMVQGQRSTGSTLKPFLHAAALDDGLILPTTLLPDVPTYYKNFAPKNFDETFSGAVHADQALIRSLNLPSVHLLKEYGVTRFHHLLQNLQLQGISYSPSHYGLSLILGGAESSLLELCSAYGGMVRTLRHNNESSGHYFSNEYAKPSYISSLKPPEHSKTKTKPISAAAIYQTLETLTEVKRPLEDQTWKYFEGKQKIAWKTGTSYGHKDAWAIGTNGDYVVGIWVGNADGEGRTGNTGLRSAAPILFDVFDLLPHSDTWFRPPIKELYSMQYCTESGHLATPLCPHPTEKLLPAAGAESSPCPYHQLLHTTKDGQYRVTRDCAQSGDILTQSWFILPPKMEYYFKDKNPSYQQSPPFHPDCQSRVQNMSVLYPPLSSELRLPTNIQNKPEKMVAKVAHKIPRSTVYWYLDQTYIGKTSSLHEMELRPSPGEHMLIAMDERGEKVFRKLFIH